jgi:teichuronic acid biosynthesis glycosyltransferase TuaG
MSNPIYSFITCTYQCVDYINRCYWSLKQQTLFDWEWIVVDDGSTDGTEKVIAELNDCRVRYYRFEVNCGRGIARSYALHQASGLWSAIIDMDDLCFPDRLEQAEKARRAGFDFFCSAMLLINYKYVIKGVRGFKTKGYPRSFSHATLCARTELLQTISYPLYKAAEDQSLVFTLANNYRGYYCSKPLYVYHEDASINLKRAVLGHIYVYQQIKEMLEKGILKRHISIHLIKVTCLIKLVCLIPCFLWPKLYLKSLTMRAKNTPDMCISLDDRRGFIRKCSELFPIV